MFLGTGNTQSSLCDIKYSDQILSSPRQGVAVNILAAKAMQTVTIQFYYSPWSSKWWLPLASIFFYYFYASIYHIQSYLPILKALQSGYIVISEYCSPPPLWCVKAVCRIIWAAQKGTEAAETIVFQQQLCHLILYLFFQSLLMLCCYKDTWVSLPVSSNLLLQIFLVC